MHYEPETGKDDGVHQVVDRYMAIKSRLPIISLGLHFIGKRL